MAQGPRCAPVPIFPCKEPIENVEIVEMVKHKSLNNLVHFKFERKLLEVNLSHEETLIWISKFQPLSSL